MVLWDYGCFTSILGHLSVWGELASHKRPFNPPPQFSRLGIQACVLFISCVMYIHVMYAMAPLFVWAGIRFLFSYCALLASVLCTCISM